MPRFLPTIDIEPSSVESALRAGTLKLQPGQWIQCGPGKPSRFSHASSTTIYAAHPDGAFNQGKIRRGKLKMLRDLAPQPTPAHV